MADSLPDAGASREIFLRALRFYSDSCEAPGLHPDCPFAVDTRDGRGCGEECMDLLARYDVPGRGEIRLREGIALIRGGRRPRRLRRGPSATTPPYDSRQAYLTDTANPNLPEWKLASLLGELREKLIEPGFGPMTDDRTARIHQVSKELESRAIDADGLIRGALGRDIAAAISFGTHVVRDREVGLSDQPLSSLREGWHQHSRNALVDVPDTPRGKAMAFARMFGGVLAWVAEAPLDEVIDLAPPAELPFERPAAVQTNVAHQWLLDRCTITYLDQWETSSLKAEWEYLRGERLGPCTAQEMRERRIDEGTLARVLADRYVNEAETDDSGDRIPVGDYVPKALALLRSGRRSDAVLLYETLSELAPENAEVHNNLGFCVLPDDPDRALRSFEEAIRRGYAAPSVTAANRMFALYLSGRYAAALAIAEQMYVERPTDAVGPCWLWDTRAADPKVVEVTDIVHYVTELAVSVCERATDPELQALWVRRLEALRC